MNDTPSADVRRVRDFVNTAEPQLGTDQLGPETAATCLAGLGLASARVTLTAADRALLVGVREGLRALLLGHAGHAALPSAMEELDELLRRVPLTVRLSGGTPVLDAVGDAPGHRVVAAVLTAVLAASPDEWARLKVCARDTCRWAFYDASRNHSGRWCSMAGCGNIVKMRRARRTRAVGTGRG